MIKSMVNRVDQMMEQIHVLRSMTNAIIQDFGQPVEDTGELLAENLS
jgi:hypothetical protein